MQEFRAMLIYQTNNELVGSDRKAIRRLETSITTYVGPNIMVHRTQDDREWRAVRGDC